MLQVQLKVLYRWWINWDFDYANAKWVVLELVPPKEILTPFKAMEDVFSVVWPLMDVGNFREQWCDGELENGPYWFSWEIASLEGRVHFYIRCLRGHKPTFEMALYAHYPDLEINEVPDYTRLVPSTIPNEEWNMYGEDFDYRDGKEDAYPIKTYEKFLEPQGEKISAEEKRMDPILGLLEGLSRLGPGENYWVQFITVPVNKHDEPDIYKSAQKIINKIAQRKEKKEPTFMDELAYVARQFVFGPEKDGESFAWPKLEEDDETGELRVSLTPGERETISEVERKMSKSLFRTTIRGVYVARRDAWKSPNRIILRAYVSHFSSEDLNQLGFRPESRTRIHYFLRERRVFLRSRKMLRNAVMRFPPMFPKRMSDDLNPIMSSEELASMFHLPMRTTGMISPTLEKIESRKAGPPPNLPVE